MINNSASNEVMGADLKLLTGQIIGSHSRSVIFFALSNVTTEIK